ncbi:transmembrane protein 209 isoform X1 [Neodiprion virginianus]|uniref:transmembrane protein 209 isoform X1 n=1 Tax=Neodiprion fabricii TaxID=2872261 RepID=UPI001ED8FE9A|nr:transmembrane protein 209 isoform X1 [Neodiprion fabricii]XP_046602889.1 transmembrane protein 209 isoform X1 [Neodiprion virginianus]
MSNFHSPMRCISPNARVLTPKPQVQQTLDLRQTQTKVKNSITWFFINTSLLSVVIYDILYGGVAYKPFCWIEWCLASILALNAVYHIVSYAIATLSIQPVVLSPRQRKLLGVTDNDPLFKTEVPTPQKLSEPSSPQHFSTMNLSWRSNTLGSPGLNESKDYTVSSPFYKYNSPSSPRKLTVSPNTSLNKSFNNSLNGSLTGEGLIYDEVQLQTYLKELEHRERKSTSVTNVDQPSNLLSSFWSHPATRNPGEVSPMLRRCVYQLAPTIDKSKSTSPGAEEGNSPRGIFGAPDIWRKYRIDSNKVNQWTANLRMWISKTVVERVAMEIENVRSALVRHGLSDSQPGHVGLDRLRKLAQSPTLVAGVPTLPALVPFLELSNNQDYLVKRIKVLAKGGSMSDFKWNGGSSYNGKEWDNSLPTDTAIVMHLFASYMDTQLEAPLDQPDARPFTSRYTARAGKDLPRNKGPIIVCTSVNPPHYSLALSGDSAPNDYEEIQRGRNNMFHTLLLFLYIVKTRDHGMLGRVNLGMSGVNVLWVIDG